ncbi:DUF1771-domain-containing protein [Sparassis latifolia]
MGNILGSIVSGVVDILCGSPIKEESAPPQGQQYIPPVEVPHKPVTQQYQPAYPVTQRPPHPSPPPHPVSPPPRNQAQANQQNEHYTALRARASEAGAQMARSFEESHAAYAGGERARAKELSNEGKAHQREMERLNAQASEWIFTGECVGREPGEVDLHGLFVKEAITYSDQAIQGARRRGDAKLHLIVGALPLTGKGLHSPNGVAKLKPAIEELMQQNGLIAELDQSNEGVLIVNLDGQPSGQGRVIRPDDIARGLERRDEGCTIM